MPVDTGIYNAFLQPPKSSLDYANQFAQAESLRNQNALTGINLRQAANVESQKNALRSAVQSGQLDLSNPNATGGALAMAPDVAPALLKTIQDQRTSSALASKDTALAANANAEAEGNTFKNRVAKANQAITDISNLGTPQDAINGIQQHLSNGDIDLLKASSLIQSLQPSIQDPTQFAQWKRQMVLGIMDAKDRIAATAPKVSMSNTGGSLVPVNENADAAIPVGQIAGAATIKTTASPDAVLQANTSRANNRDTIAAENLRAGVSPDGKLDDNAERTAQAIATGQLQPPQGMALLNPKNQRILGRVMEINPQYDSTTVTAKKAAATAFTSGQQGNQLRSFATSGQHLDQLGQLIDALDNGNNQTINKVGNAIQTWNGATPVTNFDAAKDVVAKEVMKAIVAGGGGQSEREELAKSLSSANSPAQLKGVVKQYRNLMTAQADNLLAQRRAAGLPDSTLPNYAEPTGGAAPAGLPSADAIAAELARRGH